MIILKIYAIFDNLPKKKKIKHILWSSCSTTNGIFYSSTLAKCEFIYFIYPLQCALGDAIKLT